MRRVLIESPLKDDYVANRAYAKRCVRDSLSRGEAPYASHLFFDQSGILDDTAPEERELGIRAGLAWGEAAELTAVYTDRGISGGMVRGIHAANLCRRPVEYREIGETFGVTSDDYYFCGRCDAMFGPENGRDLLSQHLDEGGCGK